MLPIIQAYYVGFLAHWLMIALARSLVSGAASAYLYEYLHRAGAGDTYQKAEGNGRAYSLTGKIVCWPVAGLLMQWHMTSVYWLTAVSAAVALVAALSLPRLPAAVPVPRQRGETTSPWRTSVRGAWGQICTSRVLALIMFQGVAIFTLARVAQVNLFQPILNAKHMPITWHGLVLAAMTLFEVAGASRSHWVRRLVGDVGAVGVLTALMAVSLALIVPMNAVFTVVCLCAFTLASGLSYPIQRSLLNNAITDSRYRATLLSAESIIDRAVCALVAVALGAYLARGAMNEFLTHSAVGAGVLIAVLVPLFVLARRSAHGTPRAG
ncbi:MAG: MFS transporter [Longispora sp.]|nr:MFS transporter [Longispora sp. (in: high G+C Gram-positive bacteria)]